MSGTPPPASSERRRGRWVAISTGAISVLVGVLYLLMILVLDSRGPLQPPPPEALGLVLPPGLEAAVSAAPAAGARTAAAAGDRGAAAVRPPG
ncbi:MAG: hypothetical protein AAFX65_00900 [Cyanobacteria bacterium J06638_7]